MAAAAGKTSMSFLMRDPAATMRAPAYIGLVSNIGVLLWYGTAAVCLFCAAGLRRQESGGTMRSFLLLAGLITAVLGLDDLFRLHEDVLPSLGVRQRITVAVYATAVPLYLVRYRQLILRTDFLLLLFALAFLGLSVCIDYLSPRIEHMPYASVAWMRGYMAIPELRIYVEDGFKLLGIASWSAYFTRVCLTRTRTEVVTSGR